MSNTEIQYISASLGAVSQVETDIINKNIFASNSNTPLSFYQSTELQTYKNSIASCSYQTKQSYGEQSWLFSSNNFNEKDVSSYLVDRIKGINVKALQNLKLMIKPHMFIQATARAILGLFSNVEPCRSPSPKANFQIKKQYDWSQIQTHMSNPGKIMKLITQTPQLVKEGFIRGDNIEYVKNMLSTLDLEYFKNNQNQIIVQQVRQIQIYIFAVCQYYEFINNQEASPIKLNQVAKGKLPIAYHAPFSQNKDRSRSAPSIKQTKKNYRSKSIGKLSAQSTFRPKGRENKQKEGSCKSRKGDLGSNSTLTTAKKIVYHKSTEKDIPRREYRSITPQKTPSRLDSLMKLKVCKPQAESFIKRYKENGIYINQNQRRNTDDPSQDLKDQINKVQNQLKELKQIQQNMETRDQKRAKQIQKDQYQTDTITSLQQQRQNVMFPFSINDSTPHPPSPLPTLFQHFEDRYQKEEKKYKEKCYNQEISQEKRIHQQYLKSENKKQKILQSIELQNTMAFELQYNQQVAEYKKEQQHRYLEDRKRDLREMAKQRQYENDQNKQTEASQKKQEEIEQLTLHLAKMNRSRLEEDKATVSIIKKTGADRQQAERKMTDSLTQQSARNAPRNSMIQRTEADLEGRKYSQRKQESFYKKKDSSSKKQNPPSRNLNIVMRNLSNALKKQENRSFHKIELQQIKFL